MISHLFRVSRRPYSFTILRPNIEVGKPISCQGWIERTEKRGAISFVHIKPAYDKRSTQVVVPKEVCNKFGNGAAVNAHGSWQKSSGWKQEYEIIADEFRVIGPNTSTINLSDIDFDKLRNTPHLRAKNSAFAPLLRVRSHLNYYSHRFFMDRGFCFIDTPVLSRNDCEGAGEAFELKPSGFFGDQPVYLPVSAQLHLEAMACGMSDVYTIGPTFRAEKSLTRHHMAEFRMLEAECSFMASVTDICDLVEKYVKYIVECANETYRADIDQCMTACGDKISEPNLLSSKTDASFPRVSYTEAQEVLRKQGSNSGPVLTKKNEIELARYYGGPVFIHSFPGENKPFYMRRNQKGEAECFDLIVPLIGELAGGSVREYDTEVLKERIPDDLLWYAELRQCGYPQTSGFGLGVDRLLQSLIDMVKLKSRYLLVELLFGTDKPRYNEHDIHRAVMAQVETLYGDYGWASVRPSFQVKVCDSALCIVVMRVTADSMKMVTSALPFVVSIGSSDAVVKFLYEGSSMRTVEKRLINLNLKSLYAALRRNPTPAEKKILQRAISQVTGSNVAAVRL